MNFQIDNVVLRQPEPRDIEALYAQKNDPEIADLLGGYSKGYSRQALQGWIDYHAKRADEVIWIIADAKDDRCLGHVGLYKIDHRVRSAEFAIMLGDKSVWGKGIGKKCTWFAVQYGFDYLNLNRLELTVLSNNVRAVNLYEKLGFVREGLLRQVQYKKGQYLDLVMMSILREDFDELQG